MSDDVLHVASRVNPQIMVFGSVVFENARPQSPSLCSFHLLTAVDTFHPVKKRKEKEKKIEEMK